MRPEVFSSPLSQDADGRALDKVVKLPISRDEAEASAKVPATARDADQESHQPERMGRILVLAHRLGARDVPHVLETAKRHRLQFGEAAMQMGLVQREDVQFALARQFAFPYVERSDASLSQDLLAAFDPNHPAVEQLRALRSQIALRTAAGPRPHPVVAIVSPTRGDGRSFVAANLAVVFAQLGQQTLLVDACLRNPVLHHFFRLKARQGLSTALAGRSDNDSSTAIKAMPALRVMPAGPT
ncbi:MAG TPA: hypothetical protein VH278_14135, partial [Burkholderiaceae bacterium]|nr:hypothetical protein [Burkholderiaceae bacterium]